jgi:hypothetical protein
MLAPQRPRDVPLLEAVDDLNLIDHLTVLKRSCRRDTACGLGRGCRGKTRLCRRRDGGYFQHTGHDSPGKIEEMQEIIDTNQFFVAIPKRIAY